VHRARMHYSTNIQYSTVLLCLQWISSPTRIARSEASRLVFMLSVTLLCVMCTETRCTCSAVQYTLQ